MNILILFSQPWRVGGAETHVEALIAGLYSEHAITLAVNRGGDKEKLRLLRKEYPKISIIEIQTRGINFFSWVYSIWQILNIVKIKKIDVISAQQRTSGLWARAIQNITGVPFTVTMHDAWHRALRKKSYPRQFGTMIAVSHNLAQRLVEDFGFSPDSVKVIHNGIDFTKFVAYDQTITRQSLSLSLDTMTILHVSRLSSIKGAVALVLLDSVPQLLSKRPNCKVVIIGEGPLRSQVEAKAQSLNQMYGPIVRIENFTQDILTWYSAADLIVGEGRVAIEALACLKPVIAIRNENTFFGAVSALNISEAIDVNFDGRNFQVQPEKLIEEIEKAFKLSNSEKELILQQIRKRMSIKTMVQQYLQVFKEEVEKGKYGKHPIN
jgi:glycosyltransferase involved in cell wall biosynthesis